MKPDGTMEYVIMDESVPLSDMLPTTGGTPIYVYFSLGVLMLVTGGLLMMRELKTRKK